MMKFAVVGYVEVGLHSFTMFGSGNLNSLITLMRENINNKDRLTTTVERIIVISKIFRLMEG